MNVSMKPRETTLNFTAAGGSPVKSVKAVQEPIVCIPFVSGGPNYYGSGEPVIGEHNGVMEVIYNPSDSSTYYLHLMCSKSINQSDLTVKRNNTNCPLTKDFETTLYVAYLCTTSAPSTMENAWQIYYKNQPFCNILLTAS